MKHHAPIHFVDGVKHHRSERLLDWEILRGLFFYDVVGFQVPKKGEYYLSGATVEAYRAPNDLTTEFYVVIPTAQAKQIHTYVEDKKINNGA